MKLLSMRVTRHIAGYPHLVTDVVDELGVTQSSPDDITQSGVSRGLSASVRCANSPQGPGDRPRYPQAPGEPSANLPGISRLNGHEPRPGAT